LLDQATPCEGVCEFCQVVTKWGRRQIELRVRTILLCAPSSIGIRVRTHPLALAESGWGGSVRVRQNTRQGREGGALPEPL
jgi:hypothetical protein